MNREIKLRVWDNHLKTMQEDAEQFHETITRLNDTTGRYVIEQWTGLLDKHGTRIFEGDVVKLDDNPDVAKGTEFYSHEDVSHHEVFWDEKRACFWDRRIEDGDSGACHADGDISFLTEGVVLGNIHTSPDLIK